MLRNIFNILVNHINGSNCQTLTHAIKTPSIPAPRRRNLLCQAISIHSSSNRWTFRPSRRRNSISALPRSPIHHSPRFKENRGHLRLKRPCPSYQYGQLSTRTCSRRSFLSYSNGYSSKDGSFWLISNSSLCRHYSYWIIGYMCCCWS